MSGGSKQIEWVGFYTELVQCRAGSDRVDVILVPHDQTAESTGSEFQISHANIKVQHLVLLYLSVSPRFTAISIDREEGRNDVVLSILLCNCHVRTLHIDRLRDLEEISEDCLLWPIRRLFDRFLDSQRGCSSSFGEIPMYVLPFSYSPSNFSFFFSFEELIIVVIFEDRSWVLIFHASIHRACNFLCKWIIGCL